jgi:pimeloyl-ACP methyl ester carboxylesterase
MIHKRLFKVLGNLSLLVVLFTGQVAAAPIHSLNEVNEVSSVSGPLQLNSDVAAQPNELLQQSEDGLPFTGETIRISGEDGGYNPSISMDGYYVAYESEDQVFIHEMLTNTSTLIDSGGSPYISATGEYIVYTKGDDGIWLWNKNDESKKYVATGNSASVSADGRYIAYYSPTADNVFVNDLLADEFIMISTVPSNLIVLPGNISADGKFVTFVAGRDLYLHNMLDHTVTNLTNDSGVTYMYAEKPNISVDGKYISFLDRAEACDNNCYSGYYIDIWDGETGTYEKVDNGNFRSNTNERPASFSADGRFVAAISGSGVYVYDKKEGEPHEISVSPDGESGNGISSDVSISANGQYIVYSSLSTNLVAGDIDINNKADVFVRSLKPKPPLVLVHGLAQGHTCEQGIHRFDSSPSSSENEKSTFETNPNLAHWFQEQGFDVWIAHWDDQTKIGGPSIIDSGDCLLTQLRSVGEITGQPLRIVAHSMGGQVARVAMAGLPSDIEVTDLYTLGAPHAGFPDGVLELYLSSLNPSPGYTSIDSLICLDGAICQETIIGAISLNSRYPNLQDVNYYFLGGDVDPDQQDEELKCNVFQILEGGKTDCFPGSYSTVGWVDYLGQFVPSRWPNASPPRQYWTDETHSVSLDADNNYYSATSTGGRSDSFECILALMNNKDEDPDTQYCHEPVTSTLSSTEPVNDFVDVASGTLNTGVSTSILVEIDTNSKSTFYMVYEGNAAPDFTLTRPDTQVVDPVYAEANSAEVNFEISGGDAQTSPYIMYSFNVTQPGTWQINIAALDTTSYKVFSIIETQRTLTIETDKDLYQIGDVAFINANLENDGVGVVGATVTANIARPDLVVDTVTLSELGGGVYTASYTVPATPGNLEITINASGIDAGINFTRRGLKLVPVAPNDVQLTDSYTETLIDDNNDGLYESLNINAGVNVIAAGSYAVNADLYAGSQFVSYTSDTVDLTISDQELTFSFDGAEIRSSGLDGPYTITHLFVTPVELGIPTASVDNAFTTSALTYTQFGTHPCYLLSTGHTGEGSDPVISPSRSDGCFADEFVPGEFIEITGASPSEGWSIGSWSGTIADASTAETNTALTPADSHSIIVNYLNATASWNTFTGGSGSDQAYHMTEDANGNVYISGSSTESWGTPSQTLAGNSDGYVVKTDPYGTMLWRTFLGGTGTESLRGIATDNDGNVYVTGYSYDGWGDPVRPYSGDIDAFVAKLDPSGTLLWNTFLGGSGSDRSYNIVLDENGNVYVNGHSPTSWETPQRPFTDINDGFVAKLDSSGVLIWNTFLGGSGSDFGFGINLDESGNVYATGYSDSSWGTPSSPYILGTDAFAVKLDPAGDLVWNTFLGGSGNDLGYDITVNAGGDVFVAGRGTESWGDPVLPHTAGADGMAARLDSSGTLIWNTFFGGNGTDYGYNIKLDGNGNLNIAGGSDAGWGLPVEAYHGDYDAFFVKLDPSGGILANTFAGGNGLDKGYGLSLSDNGNIYLGGYSNATWGNPVRAYTAYEDGFLTRFNIDNLPLIVSSVIRDGISPTTSANVSFTVKFSEPVTGVDASDFVLTTTGVTGPNVGSVTGSGDTYTVTVNTGSGDGTIRLDVGDNDTVINSASASLAGEFTSGQTYFIDQAPPTVLSSVRVSASPSASASVDFTVTFSEPVTGVDVSDFSLTTNDLTGESVESVTGSGDTYTVTVNTGSGSGTIHLGVLDDDTIVDAVLTPLAGEFTSGETYAIDKVPPTVLSSLRVSASPSASASVDFTVTFSEPVTGVDVSDFSLTTNDLTGESVESVTGSGDTYTVTVNTGSGSGTIHLGVMDDDSIVDAASTPLADEFTSGQTYTIDKTPPMVQSSLRAVTTPAAASKITFTVNFSETVTGVNTSDFSLTTTGSVAGASVASVSGSDSVYTVTVNTGSGSGTIRLNVVDDDTIVDVVANQLGGTGAGNGNFTTGQTYTITSLTTNSVAAQDGWVVESLENSNVGGAINTAATSLVVGDNVTNRQYRGILHFDTSTLPDTAVITSVILKVKQLGAVTGTNPFTTHGSLVVDIKKPNFGAAAALAIDDFQSVPGQAATGTFGSTAVASWFSAVLNVNGYSSVNLTGTTQLRLAFTLDDNNDAGADFISFSSGNDVVANRPQFIIEYYIP